MRALPSTILLAVLIAGCGFEAAPTAPEDLGSTTAEPFAEPAFAATATNLWTTKASMPSGRYELAAGVVNGMLYAIGGAAPDTRLATVQAYSTSSNTWITKAPLPSKRAYLNGAGTINGVLYVAGGLDVNNAETRTLFAYSPST